jgi:hypothetical protein
LKDVVEKEIFKMKALREKGVIHKVNLIFDLKYEKYLKELE